MKTFTWFCSKALLHCRVESNLVGGKPRSYRDCNQDDCMMNLHTPQQEGDRPLRTKNGNDLDSHDSANPTKTLVADLHNDTYSHRSLEVRQHSLRFHTNLGVERSNNFLGAQENEPVAWSKAKESSFHVCNNAPRLWHPMRGAAHFGHLHKAQEGLHGLVPTNAIVGTALLRMNSASLPNTLTM